MKRRIRFFFSVNSGTLTLWTILFVIGLFVAHIPILELIELKSYDLRFLSRGRIEPSPAIVLGVIDEKSLDREGRWPWPRSKLAKLVDIISSERAKVIAFDIGFFEPDKHSYLNFLETLERKLIELDIRHPLLSEVINEGKIEADQDLVLAKAISNSKASVVLGYFFHMEEQTLDYRISQEVIQKNMAQIRASSYKSRIFTPSQVNMSLFVKKAYAPEANLEIYAKATEAAGFFNMDPDLDGVVRWMPLIIQCGEDSQDIFPPLSLLCAWDYLDRPQMLVRSAQWGIMGIHMGERFIPTAENGKMLINYLGPEKTFPHYSITDILHGNLPKGTLRDKIVLLGATATAIYDLRNTPFSPVYPGLEIHATVVDNILKQSFLHKPQWAKIYDLLAIICLGVLVGVVLPRLGAIKGLAFASALFISHFLVARWLFTTWSIWINMVYPLMALTLSYTSLTVYRYITEERERKRIKGAFSYYVSSSVVNEMLKYPERLKLGGEKKDLSILFSDIRGFTTISESLGPEELVHLINEYLTVMTDVVFKYGGTLDKYMGDAIMAIYGAPLDQEDHPFRACHSALEMMDKLKDLNERWLREGKTPLDIGIGINTGMMMVGNMGSVQRFDYTVMGDAVNLGSRLEGANKNYKTHILISEFTYERVKEEFVCLEVDSVQVKGKTQPVKIYQLLGCEEAPDTRRQAIFLFLEGLNAYKSQRWDEAVRSFQAVMKMDPELGPAEVYLQRCRYYKVNPPKSAWNGIFTMKSK